MKVYFYTTKGVDKAESEDRILVGQDVFSETEACVDLTFGNVAIADGVGGNLGGSVAAQFVCEQLAQLFQPKETDLSAINKALIEKSSQDNTLSGMATTMSGIWFDENGTAFIYHVGNTRVYAIQAQQYLNQLTADDTVVAFLVRTGRLSEEEAEDYPAKNEITACFGGGKASLLNASFIPLDTEAHRQLLFTCDGVHDILTVDDIEDIVSAADGNWAKAVHDLVSSAKGAGSTDDCSAAIVDLDYINQDGKDKR